MSNILFHLKIPIPLRLSTNAIYAGVHYRTRNMHKQTYRDYFEWIKGKLPKVTEYPVDISMTFFLTGRLMDSSNTSYMFKLIEDALVKSGVLTDDTVKYVKWVSHTVEKTKDRDMVEIKITKSIN